MKNLREELIILANKWQQEIVDYAAAQKYKYSSEDHAISLRNCLLDVYSLLRDTAETPVERIKWSLKMKLNGG